MNIPLPTAKRKARIEIIPLIDVVFFLLATFVMLSLSMVKNQGINVNLPVASTGVSQDRKIAITITLTKEGDLYLNKERINPDLLPARLQQFKASDPDLKVFINGDEAASFGNAIHVLDTVRTLGITKVSIQTKGSSPREDQKK